jgi:histidyl-tRNA synthetase
VLVVNFGGEALQHALGLVRQLRAAQIPTELYPEPDKKMKKQFSYADKKGVPYVLIAGEAEIRAGQYQLKDMQTGSQQAAALDELIDRMRIAMQPSAR